MSPETKARIEAVISELGYRPNKMAQGLKATVSHLVGVTIADIGNPFSSLLLKGIQQECRARDVQLLVSDSNNQASFERANIESLLDAQVDGLIVNTVGNNDDWLSEYCARRNHKPMVMLDRIVQPIVCDCVATDNHGAGVRRCSTIWSIAASTTWCWSRRPQRRHLDQNHAPRGRGTVFPRPRPAR